MDLRIEPVATAHSPESLVTQLRPAPGVMLLGSGGMAAAQPRGWLVVASPFLTFRAFGSRCEITVGGPGSPRADGQSAGPVTNRQSHGKPGARQSRAYVQFGNPWRVLDELMGRYEFLDEPDVPFPLGGCFGFWGYDLKNFIEPKLSRRAANDWALPDCQVGFYDSLVAFDGHSAKTWIVSTGLEPDGSRSPAKAAAQAAFWRRLLESDPPPSRADRPAFERRLGPTPTPKPRVVSTLSRQEYMDRVVRALRYIRAGHIYQINLAHRLAAPWLDSGWAMFQRLAAVSPAPWAAFMDAGDFQLASASPELFLRLSGTQVATRPIKGTRPRAPDADQDARLAYELQTSAKERAELVMITDLLRNDLGKICEFGSVRVPELMRLERFAHVQHLVATVEGQLRPAVTHLAALEACFPGGSVTGAPKVRAMEIIDELEPVMRGPFTGALGYLGFNRESQLSILIRTAICKDGAAFFPVGAGIVADSDPAAEYEETLAKAAGFFAALRGSVPMERSAAAPSGNVSEASSLAHSFAGWRV